jgi:TldD protein
MAFEERGQRAIDTAVTRGCTYVDVRFESVTSERIEVRNGRVAALSDSRSTGVGIRALVDGAWGFSATADLSDAGIDAAAARAVEIARASATVARRRFGDAPHYAHVGRYATPVKSDPRTIALGTRVALLLEAEQRMHVSSRIAVARSWLDLWRTQKSFFSSTGSAIDQEIVQCGVGLAAMAVGETEVQTRVYPGDVGLYGSGGWEIVEEADLLANAARIAEEADALLDAPQCPTGTFDLILGGSQMSLQIHESCGHPAELDRVMGWEANFSGTSFLEIEQLDRLRYGSELVTIVVDNTMPRGLATCGYDDEGTASTCSEIIGNGILRGYEMSNDTARAIGRESNGCVRAQSWEYAPMIRMCNLSLLPGSSSFDDLFDGVTDGIYMEGNRSWSIDDRRLNFQFGCQIGWEVKRGKRGRMLKNPTYSGVTPAFWNSCDAIADRRFWKPWGTPNCGKGEPMQVGRTTQGAAPARFRDVTVGIGYHD